MPIFSWVTPTFFSLIRFFIGFVTSCEKINGCCTWKNGHLTPKTSVTQFLGSNAHFFMKYTHFFSPWVDFLFNSDYSEPFETNLDQFWLFRTISRPFLANLGCFLTCFWGQIPIFSWVTPAFDIDFGLRWIIWDYFGPIWTNWNHFRTISGQFGIFSDIFVWSWIVLQYIWD